MNFDAELKITYCRRSSRDASTGFHLWQRRSASYGLHPMSQLQTSLRHVCPLKQRDLLILADAEKMTQGPVSCACAYSRLYTTWPCARNCRGFPDRCRHATIRLLICEDRREGMSSEVALPNVYLCRCSSSPCSSVRRGQAVASGTRSEDLPVCTLSKTCDSTRCSLCWTNTEAEACPKIGQIQSTVARLNEEFYSLFT